MKSLLMKFLFVSTLILLFQFVQSTRTTVDLRPEFNKDFNAGVSHRDNHTFLNPARDFGAFIVFFDSQFSVRNMKRAYLEVKIKCDRPNCRFCVWAVTPEEKHKISETSLSTNWTMIRASFLTVNHEARMRIKGIAFHHFTANAEYEIESVHVVEPDETIYFPATHHVIPFTDIPYFAGFEASAHFGYINSLISAMFWDTDHFDFILIMPTRDTFSWHIQEQLRKVVNIMRTGHKVLINEIEELRYRLSRAGWETDTLSHDPSELFQFISKTLELPLVAIKSTVHSEEITDTKIEALPMVKLDIPKHVGGDMHSLLKAHMKQESVVNETRVTKISKFLPYHVDETGDTLENPLLIPINLRRLSHEGFIDAPVTKIANVSFSRYIRKPSSDSDIPVNYVLQLKSSIMVSETHSGIAPSEYHYYTIHYRDSQIHAIMNEKKKPVFGSLSTNPDLSINDLHKRSILLFYEVLKL